MIRHCIICHAALRPQGDGTTRGRTRKDKRCCSATCRKRLQRRRVAGGMVCTDLPGQQRLFSVDRDNEA